MPGQERCRTERNGMRLDASRASVLPRTILAIGLASALIIAAGAGAFYVVAVRAPSELAHRAKEETFDAADRMAKGFKSAFDFTPRVTVDGVTVIEQSQSVIELATVEQELAVQYRWSQTWLGSTKTMELQGFYRAKAGFNLRESFQVSVQPSGIVANLPVPKVLSMEMIRYKVQKDESGWWNHITAAERENALTSMQEEARSKVAQSGLLRAAQEKFKEELSRAVKGQNISTPLEIHFQDSPQQISGTHPRSG